MNSRRGLAGFFLCAAILLLGLGLTVLRGWLKNSWPFVIFWSACFLFTFLAALLALLDMMLLRHQLRTAQKSLIENALDQTKSREPAPPEK